jgi:hypothetical protein
VAAGAARDPKGASCEASPAESTAPGGMVELTASGDVLSSGAARCPKTGRDTRCLGRESDVYRLGLKCTHAS